MTKNLLYLFLTIIITAIILYEPGYIPTTELSIAVASNFSEAIKEITKTYNQKTGISSTLSFGSTGKLYAQISNGAPYDIFLAADKLRPRLLEKEGLALPGSRFTYALGKLVLWSPVAGYVDSAGKVLQKNKFRYLAMANPNLAPHGRAAKEVLQALNLWDSLSGKIAYGENIGQAFNFTQSTNSELGFIAYAQLKSQKYKSAGSYWDIPQTLYTPIEQQAILLKEKAEARSFLVFLQSTEAQKIITDYGYIIP